jgi:hypothetical protein
MSLYEKITNDVPQLKRGLVWCHQCGRTQKVNSANSLESGWPKCCGYTMSIDSPEERKRLAFERKRETKTI